MRSRIFTPSSRSMLATCLVERSSSKNHHGNVAVSFNKCLDFFELSLAYKSARVGVVEALSHGLYGLGTGSVGQKKPAPERYSAAFGFVLPGRDETYKYGALRVLRCQI